MPDTHEATPAPPALCDLVSLWPGAGEEARAALEQRWLSLPASDRAAALARAPSVLRAFTVSGRRRLFSLSTYLAGRNWREFDSRPMPALGDREKHAQHAAMSWAWRQRLAPVNIWCCSPCATGSCPASARGQPRPSSPKRAG